MGIVEDKIAERQKAKEPSSPQEAMIAKWVDQLRENSQLPREPKEPQKRLRVESRFRRLADLPDVEEDAPGQAAPAPQEEKVVDPQPLQESKPHLRIPPDIYERVSPQAIAVYIALVRHADNVTRETWVSMATIAKKMHRRTDGKPVSVRTVQRGISELRDAGFIEIEHRQDKDGAYTSSLYRLPL